MFGLSIPVRHRAPPRAPARIARSVPLVARTPSRFHAIVVVVVVVVVVVGRFPGAGAHLQGVDSSISGGT